MLKNKKILITGGAGFIGTHLTAHLVKDNEIRILDLSKNIIQTTNLLDEKNVKFIKGNILDSKVVNKETKGVDMVIHMASVAHVDNVYKNPYTNLEICIDGTKNALDASIRNKVDRFIYFSTSEVYGPYAFGVSEDVITKQGTNKDQRWTYGLGKISGEHLTIHANKTQGLRTTIVRPFNIYGEGQIGNGAIPMMVSSAFMKQQIILNGEGNQVRAWCHISDFINALGEVMLKEKAIGKTYNIGNPYAATTNYSLSEMIKSLIPLRPIETVYVKDEREDVETRVPNIAKIKKELKWDPTVDLHTGLVTYIRWFRWMIEKAKNG